MYIFMFLYSILKFFIVCLLMYTYYIIFHKKLLLKNIIKKLF